MESRIISDVYPKSQSVSNPKPRLEYGKSDNGNKDADGTDSVDFYTNLITKGPYVPVDHGSSLESIRDIPWFDETLIKESAVFHEKYFFYDTIVFMSALVFGFAIKPSSAVLLKTGRLHEPSLSFHRYLSTIYRVYHFFDIALESPESFKHIQTVRKMHGIASRKSRNLSQPSAADLKLDEPWKKDVVEAMHKDLEFLNNYSLTLPVEHYDRLLSWDPPVPVSQFDMVTTQLGVWATIWLFPETFGIADRVKEMRGVIHSWAVIGRLLGIKDEFNICLQLNRDPDLYSKMFRELVLQSLQTLDTTVVTIQAAFMEAFSWRFPFISHKSVLYHGLNQWEGYEGSHLWNIMTWRDKLCVHIYQLLMCLTRNSSIFRVMMNHAAKLWFQLMIWMYLPTNKHA